MSNPLDRIEEMQIKGNSKKGLYVQRKGRRFEINENEFKLRSGDTVLVTFHFHHKDKITVRKKRFLEK